MFVLAHLSDPHLGPVPLPRFAELSSKRGLGFLNWLRSRRLRHRPEVLDRVVRDLKAAGPDHIVVTGDLVNLALHAEFAPAQRWLAGLGSPHDVTLVPGNHDAYARDAILHSGLHWGEYMRGDGIGLAAPPGTPMHFPFERRRGPVALIGLSTAVPTGPLLATGRLGALQLMRLADSLAHLGHEPVFRVVLIHHPPVSRRRHHLKRLIDEGSFRRVIAKHGAELVLHGHSHVHSLSWLDGPSGKVPAVGVPSASASLGGALAPAAYNLYRVAHQNGSWRCEAILRGIAGPNGVLTELARHRLIG
jgi:3',5'-cyclic AMP phosphodiesterase CpdA